MSHITYEQFREEFLEKCHDVFSPDEYEIKVQEVKKITGSYEGIMFVQNGKQYGVCVNPVDLYARHLSGTSIETLINEIQMQSELPVYKKKLEGITDYSNIRERLFIRVSNAEINQKVLAEVPHQRQGEFAITAHIAMVDTPFSLGSIMISNDMLETYGISEAQLFEDAFDNSPKLFAPDVVGYSSDPEGEKKMYLVTNSRRLNGAAVMFYDGFLEKLAKQIGSDFFVIPSSIHEMIIWPYVHDIQYSDLEKTLKLGNRDFMSPGEALSEHIYYVSPERLQLERADQCFTE